MSLESSPLLQTITTLVRVLLSDIPILREIVYLLNKGGDAAALILLPSKHFMHEVAYYERIVKFQDSIFHCEPDKLHFIKLKIKRT